MAEVGDRFRDNDIGRAFNTYGEEKNGKRQVTGIQHRTFVVEKINPGGVTALVRNEHNNRKSVVTVHRLDNDRSERGYTPLEKEPVDG